MNFREFVQEDRRLVILRLMAESDMGYSANSSVLQLGLESVRHVVSRDVVHTDLAWLSEQGLLKVEVLSTVHVATLTTRGLDVAMGRATVPGVKRPDPA